MESILLEKSGMAHRLQLLLNSPELVDALLVFESKPAHLLVHSLDFLLEDGLLLKQRHFLDLVLGPGGFRLDFVQVLV